MKNIVDREIDSLNIENRLHEILYFKDAPEFSIKWGMNYITFAPSKRVRPLLLLEANKIFNEIDNDSYILCSSVELIHTYSLVHDDLPCMDDDELRRGIKTLHTLKNEAYALLVGDALLTRGFGILSEYKKYEKLPQIISLINKKSGLDGMILGQYLDLEGEKKTLNIDEINRINRHKTANLLELSLILGAINAGADKENIDLIEKMGEIFGHIFQIKDDILDVEGESNIIGKPVGSDEKNKKSSLVNILGIDKAKTVMKEYKEKAISIINTLPSNRDFFLEFVDFLINRNK